MFFFLGEPVFLSFWSTPPCLSEPGLQKLTLKAQEGRQSSMTPRLGHLAAKFAMSKMPLQLVREGVWR